MCCILVANKYHQNKLSIMSDTKSIQTKSEIKYLEIKSLGDERLEKCVKRCSRYLDDPMFVYKMCNGMWIVVLQKLESQMTSTNEARDDVSCKSFAKYRANKLRVIDIFDADNVDMDTKSITNRTVIARPSGDKAAARTIETVYEVGKIVEPDSYDTNINSVCAGGIHYFKTIYAAYFYRQRPQNYSGCWLAYYENGQMSSSTKYVMGTEHGQAITFYINGVTESRGEYIYGQKNGLWVTFRDNGQVVSRETYVLGETLQELYSKQSTGQLVPGTYV